LWLWLHFSPHLKHNPFRLLNSFSAANFSSVLDLCIFCLDVSPSVLLALSDRFLKLFRWNSLPNPFDLTLLSSSS
jgi:hypothetical protein